MRLVALILSLLVVLPLVQGIPSPTRGVGGVWLVEPVVESDGVPDIVLDAGGAPHIVHMDAGRVRYATRGIAGWQHEVLPDDVTGQISIGPNGEIRIASNGRFNGNAMPLHLWERNSDATWTALTLDPTMIGRVKEFTHDSSGWPHILTRQDGDIPTHHWQDQTGWHKEPISTFRGFYSDMAIDAAGGIHVAFQSPQNPTFAMRYAYKAPNATAWQTTTLVDGEEMSIAVTADGWPHISYNPIGSNGLLVDVMAHAWLTPGGWNYEVVDTDSPSGRGSSIAVDSEGRVHVAYQQLINRGWPDDPSRGHIKYATQFADGTWVIEFPDPHGFHSSPSLALDKHGQPHTAYLFWSTQPSEPTGLLEGQLRLARPAAAPAWAAAWGVPGGLP